MKQSILDKFIEFIKPPIITTFKTCQCLQNTPALIKVYATKILSYDQFNTPT